MITQQEKQKVFALYWGQTLIVTNDIGMYYDTSSPNESIGHAQVSVGFTFNFDLDVILNATRYNQLNHNIIYERCSLLVTPLHLITDEHAVEVAKIMNCKICGENVNEIKDHLSGSFNMPARWNGYNYLEIFDFLRSKGYALPCFGLQVDSLVEQGVFKLREPNKQ